MGNSQPKYLSDKEACEAIGQHTATRLSLQLSKNGKYLDYSLFTQILLMQFDTMPKPLIECLYYAFASDLDGKVEIKNFISALAAVVGEPELGTLLKFVSRVYSQSGNSDLDRSRAEKILKLAYGKTLNVDRAVKELDALFGDSQYLSQKDFETFSHPLPILSGWIQAVLTIFIEDLPPRLASLDRRYSSAQESELMMARYGVLKSTCDHLRQIYYTKCGSHGSGGSTKGELSLEDWNNWTQSFLPKTLAQVIYSSKLDPPLKTVWRFVDFAEFCMVYGRSSSIEDVASALCVAFHQHSQIACYNQDHETNTGITEDHENSDDDSLQKLKKTRYNPSVSNLEMKRLVCLLSLPSASHDRIDLDVACSSTTPLSLLTPNSEESLMKMLLEGYADYLNPLVLRALHNLDAQQKASDINLQSYVELISTHSSCFPGLKLLAITACCLFGLQPSTPTLEKEYITELMLWKESHTLQSSQLPYGQVGTEWCLISSEWWLKWSYYVGRANHDEPFPPPIDNWILLKKTSSKQLLPNLSLGTDFEIVTPEVFHAFQCWYGGGPKIVRKVITTKPRTSQGENVYPSKSLIEFYPLCLKLMYCDENGKYSDSTLIFEQLWPKDTKIEEIIKELCLLKNLVDPSKMRLWNIENKSWKRHIILSNDLSLEEAGIVDGQTLLIERFSTNGVWPKLQLHAQLELEENRQTQTPSTDSPTNQLKIAQSPPTTTTIQINNGKVGLENLGNTCYLNASLQALLHTNFLNEYFLTKQYWKDLNKRNKHGYGGKLALAYSSIVHDLWCSRQSDNTFGVLTDAVNSMTTSNPPRITANGLINGPFSINPRKFRKEVGLLRDQFAGDDQHDAQELLAFLLDGLSEDLNLVQEKPYIEQPDSDDRPDHILADIWWENHLRRDISPIQSIFTGQFKSITTCKNCEYNSARYEPFNMLSVPLPEEELRSLIVYIILLSGKNFSCSVRVPKIGQLLDIISFVKKYEIDGVDSDSLFLAVQMFNMKVINILPLQKSVDTIRDNDLIVFYQVQQLPVTNTPPEKIAVDPGLAKEQALRELPPPKVPLLIAIHESEKEMENSVTGGEFKILPPDVQHPQETPQEPEIIHSYDGDSDSGDEVGQKNELGEDFMQDVESEVMSDEESPKFSLAKNENTVEVIFLQRRVKFSSVGGIEMFKMEQFGLPIIEVLPTKISTFELYSIISKRLQPQLKSSISELAKSNILSANVVTTPSQTNSLKNKKNSNSGPGDVGNLPRSQSNVSIRSDSIGLSRIRPIATQDAIGGDIPPFGFVLRSVLPNGYFCSRCHWLNRCEGCALPYEDEDTSIDLEGGVTIAIDWHYVVYQEILDTQKFSDIIQHSSMKDHQSFHSKELPLEKCLQKFTEEEPLDDMVCPKCHEDKCLRRRFSLWKLPPVLIIQLKRFQFNNYSRRKLTNFVNFPLDGLDMAPYLAPTARFLYSDLNNESKSEPQEEFSQISPCYDLYSAVYHVGALGGGHYIATARDTSEDLANVLAAVNEPENNSSAELSSVSPSSPPSPAPSPSPQWYCYNDSSVTSITSDKDIVSSSAYVLFYIRKDVQSSKFQDIHHVPSSLQSHVRSNSTADNPTAQENEDTNKSFSNNLSIITESMAEAKNKLTKYIPTNIATGRFQGADDDDSDRSTSNSSQSQGKSFDDNSPNESSSDTCVQS